MANEDATFTLSSAIHINIGCARPKGILEDASRLKKMLRDSKSKQHNDKCYSLVAHTNSNQA